MYLLKKGLECGLVILITRHLNWLLLKSCDKPAKQFLVHSSGDHLYLSNRHKARNPQFSRRIFAYHVG